MRRKIAFLLILMIAISTVFVLGSCKSKEENNVNDTAASQDATNDAMNSEDVDDATETEDAEDPADVIKKIEPDSDEEIGNDLPMQIESVVLYKDGSVEIVPTEDLRKNELGDSKAKSLAPFAESGRDEEGNDERTGVVKDIFLMKIGGEGYRTIVALMDNGTLAAINPRALLEDHIVAVKDNLGGRDSFTGVEQEENEEGFSIIGKTEEGDDVRLDPVILTEENEEPEQVEQQ